MHDGSEQDRAGTPEKLLGLNRDEWGWLIFGVGAVGALGTLFNRGRSPIDWLLPLGLVGGGAALLLQEREQGIDRAQQRIAAELRALDPLARAQVMKRVAAKSGPLRRGKKTDEAAK